MKIYSSGRVVHKFLVALLQLRTLIEGSRKNAVKKARIIQVPITAMDLITKKTFLNINLIFTSIKR